MTPTRQQIESSIDALMKAICAVEAAQNNVCVKACNVDQSSINDAKDKIYRVVQKLERLEAATSGIR